MKKVVLKNLAIITGKHLCWSLFHKVADHKACNFIKKRLQYRCFSWFKIFVKYLFWRTFAYGCFWTDFTKWLSGNLFPDSCFQNHLDSVILQKYHLLSNQSFKHNLVHWPSLNLTSKLSFEPGFCMFIINGYYTKKQTLVVLGLLVYHMFTQLIQF